MHKFKKKFSPQRQRVTSVHSTSGICSHQYITKIRWSCLLADWFCSTKINYHTLLPLILFLARDMLRALSLASNFSVASRGNAATNPRNYKRHLKNVDRTSQTASEVNYDCCSFFLPMATSSQKNVLHCWCQLLSVVEFAQSCRGSGATSSCFRMSTQSWTGICCQSTCFFLLTKHQINDQKN